MRIISSNISSYFKKETTITRSYCILMSLNASNLKPRFSFITSLGCVNGLYSRKKANSIFAQPNDDLRFFLWLFRRIFDHSNKLNRNYIWDTNRRCAQRERKYEQEGKRRIEPGPPLRMYFLKKKKSDLPRLVDTCSFKLPGPKKMKWHSICGYLFIVPNGHLIISISVHMSLCVIHQSISITLNSQCHV